MVKSTNTIKKPGRPKGSKNKASKPKKIIKKINKRKKKPDGMSLAEIDAELDRLDEEEANDLKIEELYISTHRWEFFKPFKWQRECGEQVGDHFVTLAASPNGIGKTTLAICTIMSILAGYEAWNEVSADYPGAVKHDGKYFKPSPLGKLPVEGVRIRLTGNDWSHHLGQTVVREIKKWFPMDDFHTKNNTQGVTWFYTHKPTGSTLELMTHDQKIGLYESWRGHFWLPDEPPPQNIFEAFAGRALTELDGKVFIPTTPLSQAWMLDELVLKNDSDVAVIKDLCCLDNEITYDHDDNILTEMGLSGKRTKYWREMEGQKKKYYDYIMRWDLYTDIDQDGHPAPDDQGESAERFLIENTEEDKHELIRKLRFLKKAKNTSLEDKPSRFFGIFKKLVGLVVKEFNKSKHILPAFDDEVPANWIVSFQIDFHLGKPHAIAFYACSERNIHYVVDEVWENMTPEEIAYLIINRKRVRGWNIEYGEIDPLSKGDDKYMKNRDADAEDSFTIIENLLDEEDIELGVANKDKKSGFINIKSWLKGVNKIPVLYFLDNLQSIKNDMYGHIYEIQRLCYVKGEIEKVDDHFMECLYRYTLMGVTYEEKSRHYEMAGSGEIGWMG